MKRKSAQLEDSLPMRFYNATAFLFPKHYEWRILCICFGAIQLPLAAWIGLQTATGQWNITALLTLLTATLVGSGLALTAIHALLSPIAEATHLLRSVQNGEPVAGIPRGADDLVGRLLSGVATAADEAAARIKRLIDAAERDPLTGIRNRSGFEASARKILPGHRTAVLALIGIDHFKLINDQFGHDAGDIVLKTIANTLDSELRSTDLCARRGGEEFAVLLPDTMLDEARTIMERLRTSVVLNRTLDEQGWPITFSCGLAPIRDFRQFDEACSQANAALHDARNSGRSRVHFAAKD